VKYYYNLKKLFFFFFLFIWWQSRIFRSCAEVIFLWKRWSFFRIRWWTQSQKKHIFGPKVSSNIINILNVSWSIYYHLFSKTKMLLIPNLWTVVYLQVLEWGGFFSYKNFGNRVERWAWPTNLCQNCEVSTCEMRQNKITIFMGGYTSLRI